MTDEDSLLVRWRRDPTTLFVLGLTALVLCQAASPIVWWAARTETRRREQEAAEPSPFLGASLTLGVLGTVVLGLIVGFFVLTGTAAIVLNVLAEIR